ncbi:undecaprenyl-diphosphate phosphatase [Methanobacterium sp. BAmetb5]|jgi:undecaprenyl-diphosphatase|uniref:undecaprenyl-diphosphate phosphatase n=1 Tax=Methanobacterium sp. BAmetb5 TaxID=2025351 RepID=UPI000E8A2518|nr:undecaprenyl-diphosphate phosphatase [Methanobacterium sp. BAmetb5]AXV40125.1 MAG: undecaprenyl-diphosphatase [Methanobacterium sp. BAmetb5]
MDIIQAIIMGMVQGLTEFLPVSSSAHLVIVPELLGAQSSLAFDTLLHAGTLVAVIGYFWKDITSMIKSFVASLLDIPRGKFKEGVAEDPYKRLAWLVVVGTIPAGLMGVLLKSEFEALFNSVTIVGFFLLVTGVILWGSEWIAKRNIDKKGKDVKEVSFTNSLVIGVFQGLAIAPGISRSGSTIAAGLFSGLERKLAARYSFLLSIPAILGAALIQAKDIVNFDANTEVMIAGFLSAVIFSYLAVKFMMGYIQKHSLNIFAIYCWIIGALTIIISMVWV